MTTQTALTIEIAKIDVAEGFNAMEADGIARLAASIATEGLIQPLLVKATADGRATVIAGPSPRRRRAGRARAGAGHLLREERERPASLVENIHREASRRATRRASQGANPRDRAGMSERRRPRQPRRIRISLPPGPPDRCAPRWIEREAFPRFPQILIR
jgi:ParB-like chromosome segregation protein Spo0J